MDKLTDILAEFEDYESGHYGYIADPRGDCFWVTEYNADGDAIGRYKLEITFKQVPLDQ